MFDVLKKILNDLEGIDYALIGTFNLSIQGIKEVNPNDIDFVTDDKNLEKIAQKYQAQIKVDPEWGHKDLKFELDEIEVQFTSHDNNVLREGSFPKNKVFITKNDLRIPCMSLESELNFYEKGAREKDKIRVSLIKEKLCAS